MKLRDIAFDFNPLDADDMQRFEDCAKALSEIKVPGDLSAAESIRYQCAELDRFFDGVLGAGAASKLFAKAGDLGDRSECAVELSRELVEAQNKVTKAAEKITKIKTK